MFKLTVIIKRINKITVFVHGGSIIQQCKMHLTGKQADLSDFVSYALFESYQMADSLTSQNRAVPPPPPKFENQQYLGKIR